jgi:hypothetical protein
MKEKTKNYLVFLPSIASKTSSYSVFATLHKLHPPNPTQKLPAHPNNEE